MITFYLQAGLLFRVSIIAKFQLTLHCNFELHNAMFHFSFFIASFVKAMLTLVPKTISFKKTFKNLVKNLVLSILKVDARLNVKARLHVLNIQTKHRNVKVECQETIF